MIDYAKVVRLRKANESKSAIASAMGCKWDTVDHILEMCKRAYGDIGDIPDGTSSETIADRIYKEGRQIDEEYLQPDCEKILEGQRQGNDRNSLWSDYVQEATSGGRKSYSLSRFNEILTDYAGKFDICVMQPKSPGVEAQVDWVGDQPTIIDYDTKEKTTLHVFVMALPYSGYFYAEAFPDEKMASWLAGHRHAFEFFGGCPVMMVPDNCLTAVTRSRRWYFDEVVLNPRYETFMEHYSVLVKPARVYHPKDKPVVERSVRIIEDDLMRPLARLDIHSIDEYNRLLRMKLEERLKKDFTKRLGSRTSIFLSEEKKELLPLPSVNYHTYIEREAVVARDFHIQYGSAFYSVPVAYVKDKVLVRDDGFVISLYNKKKELIATHRKAVRKWQRCTLPEHIPVEYGGHGEYSPEMFLSRARKYGPKMEEWVGKVLGRSEFVVDSFRTLSTVFRDSSTFLPTVVEQTASQALEAKVFTSRGFRNLANHMRERMEGNDGEQDIGTALNDLYRSHSGEDA